MTDQATPHTLAGAHRAQTRSWPGEKASAALFAAYYRRGAQLYAAVAEVDTDHQQEATWWAGECRRLAEEYAAKILPVPADKANDSPAGPG